MNVDLQELYLVKRNTQLKTLILEYMEVNHTHCKYIAESNIETLSLFCKDFILILSDC